MPSGPKVEAVDDQGKRVLGEPVGWHVKAAVFCDLQAKILVRGQLRIFVLFPELYDVRPAAAACGAAVIRLAQRDEAFSSRTRILGCTPLMPEKVMNLSMR